MLSVSEGTLASARAIAERCRLDVRRAAGESTRVDDGFVRSVGEFLASLGVRAEQTGDGIFELDFAIEHPGQGGYAIGVECDSPAHGLLSRARAREVWRSKYSEDPCPSSTEFHLRAGIRTRSAEKQLWKSQCALHSLGCALMSVVPL